MMMLIIGFIIATLSKLLADDIKEWLAWIPQKLIRFAAMKLSGEEKNVYEEAWMAHCNDLPGNVAKCCHAVGCVVATVRMTNTVECAILRTLLVPLLWTEPMFLYVLSGVAHALRHALLDRSGPEWVRLERLSRNAGGLNVLGLNDLNVYHDDEMVSLVVRQSTSQTTKGHGLFARTSFSLLLETMALHWNTIVFIGRLELRGKGRPVA